MLQHPCNPNYAKFACTLLLAVAPKLLLGDPFTQQNLVSDLPGVAAYTDPNLKNPWGVSYSPTGPFWVSNQGSGTSTLYTGSGSIVPLVVSIPGGTPPVTGPTGQVFNGTTGFLLSNGAPAHFIFDTLNGTIDGWNSGTVAIQKASTTGAVYTGLALANSGSSTFLYAADSSGQVHVFDSTWKDVTGTTFAGKFVDPNPVAGFLPFNVQTVGSNLYVTYAKLNAFGVGQPGGYVDEFSTSGNFIQRVATGGALYAPWGLTLAPSGFGSFSNDLLIGNFGNGEILVYNPLNDAFLGTINGANGQPLVNPFLWALATRTGGTNVNINAVYFTAGINNQQNGLFGSITSVPEPATLVLSGVGALGLVLLAFRRTC